MFENIQGARFNFKQKFLKVNIQSNIGSSAKFGNLEHWQICFNIREFVTLQQIYTDNYKVKIWEENDSIVCYPKSLPAEM